MWPIQNNGSVLVYQKILRPFLLKNESKIDERLSKVTGDVSKYVEDARREGGSLYEMESFHIFFCWRLISILG